MDLISLFFSWVFNFIPWYAYVVAVIVILCLFWNVIAPVWVLLPKPVKFLIAAAALAFAAYVAGRNRGSKDERQMNQRRDANANITRDEIHAKIESLDRANVDSRLAKWMRSE